MEIFSMVNYKIIYSRVRLLSQYVINYIFKIFNKDWNSFYTYLLNKIEKKNSFDIIKKQNRKHGFYSLDIGFKFLELLKKYGLNNTDTFLDYGCGFGRVGIPVIKYINEKSYIGIDLSKERIRLAKDYIKHENLEHKKPSFFCSYKKNLSEICPNQKFDTILIYTVLCHNPPKEVEFILKEAKNFLNIDGKIFIDYVNPEYEKNYMKILGLTIKNSVKDYRITDEEMYKILDRLDFTYKKMDDFYDFQTDKFVSHHSKMLMLSHKNI